MKVVGFTIVRNAIKYDFPVLESIASILPLCDEVIVCVGKSDDDTLNLIKGIPSAKIKIHETVWDDNLRTGGLLLSAETNKAKDLAPADADWLLYIQADEVLHESGVAAAKEAMQAWKDDKRVEGLLFEYTHFYGSYSYIVEPFSHWYNREIRVIRNDKKIKSFRDGQGFRKFENTDAQFYAEGGLKLNVKRVDATICHYGWVKDPYIQKAKRDDFHKLWHDDTWVKENTTADKKYDYTQILTIGKYKGTHPAVMRPRIKLEDWNFVPGVQKLTFREKVLRFLINTFSWNPGEYRNYKLV
jgi:glycosyltransferase involved in cell wall biosynthesis